MLLTFGEFSGLVQDSMVESMQDCFRNEDMEWEMKVIIASILKQYKARYEVALF